MDDPSAPRGPYGAEPEPFVPFGVGDVDWDELRRLLCSASDDVFADDLHSDILGLLNLPIEPLSTAYRWLESLGVHLPDAIWVTEHYRPLP